MARANKRRKGTQIFDRRKVESERENEMVDKYLVVVVDEIQNDNFTHKPSAEFLVKWMKMGDENGISSRIDFSF